MRKICVVTGTRAEYGLLSRLMGMIKDSNQTQLQVIATNMHLSPKYGNTYQEMIIKLDKHGTQWAVHPFNACKGVFKKYENWSAKDGG